MRLTLKQISPLAVAICEAMGLLALSLTPEVEKPFLFSVLTLGLLVRLTRWRLPDHWLRALVIGTVLGGAGLAVVGSSGFGTAIPRAILPVHALLWLARNGQVYRYWRLALAFLEIVLASIVSPETHMFLLIFVYVMVASLALAFGFLERHFAALRPTALDRPVKAGLLGGVLISSFVIFLSSLLIFPLLPRSNWGGLGQRWATPDYTEVVSFQQETEGWRTADSRPILWVFRPDTADWKKALPWGLLRGKALEFFDGEEWRSASKQMVRMPPPPEGEGGIRLEIFREPVRSQILPVPYHARQLAIAGKTRSRYLSGEWPAFSRQDRRIQYEVEVDPNPLPYRDPPKKIHLTPPDPAVFPRLVALAQTLGRGPGTDEQKMRRLLQYLRPYRATLAPLEKVKPGEMHPVEKFLFESKAGHCELFATAVALLARGMGVPSRMIVGFRGAHPQGNVIAFRNTDAHAWVEVWLGDRGWVPLDPTPVIVPESHWFDAVDSLYEYVNAYWHRYILGYEFEWSSVTAWLQRLHLSPRFILAIAAMLLLTGIGLRWSRRKPKSNRELVGEIWQKAQRNDRAKPEEIWRNPEETYLQLRFGRHPPTANDVREFAALVERANQS